MNREEIEETRVALLKEIRNKAATTSLNASSLETLARAFAMTASAREGEPDSTVHVF